MKTLLVFSLLVSMNISAKAVVSDPAAPCADCSPTLSGTPDKAIPTDLMKTGRALSSLDDRADWVKSMAIAICGSFSSGDESVNSIDTIIRFNMNNYKGLSDPTTDQIASFWNEYIEDLTCNIDGTEIHAFHFSFDRNLAFYYLFKDYLDEQVQRKLSDKTIKINVNFVSNGQTVLDFVDSEITRLEELAAAQGDEYYRFTIKRMERTRRILIRRFDAVKASDLDSLYAKR